MDICSPSIKDFPGSQEGRQELSRAFVGPNFRSISGRRHKSSAAEAGHMEGYNSLRVLESSAAAFCGLYDAQLPGSQPDHHLGTIQILGTRSWVIYLCLMLISYCLMSHNALASHLLSFSSPYFLCIIKSERILKMQGSVGVSGTCHPYPQSL